MMYDTSEQTSGGDLRICISSPDERSKYIIGSHVYDIFVVVFQLHYRTGV